MQAPVTYWAQRFAVLQAAIEADRVTLLVLVLWALTTAMATPTAPAASKQVALHPHVDRMLTIVALHKPYSRYISLDFKTPSQNDANVRIRGDFRFIASVTMNSV